MGIGNDGIVRFDSLDTLLRSGKLDRTKYSPWRCPIAADSAVASGRSFIGYTEHAVWVFNRVVLLAAVVAFWLTLRPVLTHAERVRFTVLLLLGSMFPWHMMGFFAEVFHVVCIGLGLTFLVGVPLVVAGVGRPAAVCGVRRTSRLRQSDWPLPRACCAGIGTAYAISRSPPAPGC